MKFYIEENVYVPDESRTPKAHYLFRLKNDLILNKSQLAEDVGGYLNKFEKAFYCFRTFDENETNLNLSMNNVFDLDGGWWPLRPPIPYAKHHAGFVCTKHTIVIFMYFNSMRPDVSEKLMNYVPQGCQTRKDFSTALQTPNIYRNDFYFCGKKVGAADNYIFRDNFHMVDIVLNLKEFNDEDLKDIKFLNDKYNDYYYKKSPAYVDGIGPSPLSDKDFIDSFIHYFSDVINFDIIYSP
ncbi:MAG: hypothetical protein LBF97_00865 [Elusimicrobiota bacterium]|jgi:hypothetical protein|nr:hypothetical protein [Elusimicrobiota bacterium]